MYTIGEVLGSPTFAGLIAAGTVIASIITYARQRTRNHVAVRRIKSVKKNEVDGLQDLYRRLFYDEDPDSHYPPDLIQTLLNNPDGHPQPTHVTIENIVIVAVVRGVVEGFLLCEYYEKPKSALISYYGVNTKSRLANEQKAGLKMIGFLAKTLRKIGCRRVVYEIDKGPNSKGNCALFWRNAKGLRLWPCRPQFAYRRPRSTMDDSSKEVDGTLFVVPLAKSKPSAVMSRKDLLDVLEFVHMYCYLANYEPDSEEFGPYQSYLTKRLANYSRDLPETIPVELVHPNQEPRPGKVPRTQKDAGIPHERSGRG